VGGSRVFPRARLSDSTIGTAVSEVGLVRCRLSNIESECDPSRLKIPPPTFLAVLVERSSLAF
jgi:hypothetical protein